jgi:hypothetical protein
MSVTKRILKADAYIGDGNRSNSYGWRYTPSSDEQTVCMHWDSVQEYCEGANALLSDIPQSYSHMASLSMYNIRSAKNGIDILRNGDTSGVELINQYMKMVSANLPTLERQWKADVAGFFPNVPAFLAGEPESMWRFEHDISDTVPVRIWVNCLPSGGNTNQEIYKRGAAICALAMLLSERRSMVRICPYADLARDDSRMGSLTSYELSNPLNLAEVCAALANPETSRTLTGALNVRVNTRGTGGWLRGHCPGNYYSDAQCRLDLNAGPDDIIIPAAYFGDKIIADPVAWLHNAIKPYYEGEDN